MRASISALLTYLIGLLRENENLAVNLKKEAFLEDFSMSYQPKKIFASHIKVPGGPHVALGPTLPRPVVSPEILFETFWTPILYFLVSFRPSMSMPSIFLFSLSFFALS